MLVLPPCNPPLWPWRTLGFERTSLTGRGPVTPQHLAIFFVCVAIGQSLPCRTAIGVLFRQICEVLFAEASARLSTRCQRFGQSYRDAGFVAREDFWAVEVAAIGYSFERLGL